MNISRITAVAILATALAATSALAQPHWTLSGDAGISVGDQTDASFAWWASAHRWVVPNMALGVEVGRHRWAPGITTAP